MLPLYSNPIWFVKIIEGTNRRGAEKAEKEIEENFTTDLGVLYRIPI
jgi:hypothetical protein